MRTWHRAAVAALLLCPVAGSDSERFDEQICEMCGILVHKLETLHGALESEMAEAKAKHNERVAKRGVLGRTSRGEMPARMIEAFEKYLEERACGDPPSLQQKQSEMWGQICRRDGMDDSALRLPSGIPELYDSRACVYRVQSVCDHVRREYADELMEVTYNKLSAKACTEVIDGCDAARATKLLGPMYSDASSPHQRTLLQIGVRDTWKKMPGLEPYYHNSARHISQYEMPEGWDPDGPDEQSLPVPSAKPDTPKQETQKDTTQKEEL